MPFYWLILAGFCVWRFTHLLNAEDGPWDVVVRLRRAVGTGFWGKLLDCFYCLSMWVAAPFALLIGASWLERLLLWPALSTIAIMLECTQPPLPAAPPRVEFREDREPDDELLRTKKTAAADDLSGTSGRSGDTP